MLFSVTIDTLLHELKINKLSETRFFFIFFDVTHK